MQWNNDFSIRDHSYEICSSDSYIYFGNVIYFFGNSGMVRINYSVSIADKLSTTSEFDLNTDGWWLLTDRYDTREFLRTGYYKLKAKYTVIRGGSGTATETCYFDMLDCE